MKRIIMGIDPGTLISGYAFLKPLSGRDFELHDMGVIKPPKKALLSKRLLASVEALKALLDHFQPTELAIETQFVYKNARSALLLASFSGAFILEAAERGIPVFCYSPSIIKRAVCGNGLASKGQVQKMAQVLGKISPSQMKNDASDALACAIAHLHVPPTLRKEY